jgi:hypothetical protein
VLPANTFAPNGIMIDSEVLSRWLGQTWPVRIKGHVTRTATTVVGFFLQPGNPRAVRRTFAKVDRNGRFSLVENAAGLEGPYYFAMAIRGGDGTFRSDYGVPVSIRHGR